MILALVALAALAGDAWPDYRGPRRDGDAGEADPPLEWSERENVRWKTAVHGRGWSSPVVADGRVWLTTATEDGRELSVLAFDFESGAVLHDAVLFQVAEPQPRNGLNSYASPSPALGAGRVFVHFGYAGTAALDVETFETRWTRRDLVCDHMEGPGSSPIVWGGLVIVHMDGGDVQYAVGLDAETGATRWRRPRSAALEALPPDRRKAYCTPVVVETGEGSVLVGSGAEATYGYDPRDGRELWRVDLPGFSMSSRPLPVGDTVVVNTGFMKPRLVALRLGDVEEREAWSYDKNVATMSSPVLAGGRLYMVDDSGVATCLDAKTGERVWRERLGGRHCASPVHAAGRVYFFDRDGKTKVVAAREEFDLLARNELEAGFMASPAVVGGAFVLRTERDLYRVEREGE